MLHPILSKKINLILYSLIWFLITGIHILVLFFSYHQNLYVSLIDAVVFNTLFAIFLLSIWFVIRFGQNNKNNVFYIFLIHFFLSTISTILLIILSLVITKTVLATQFVSEYYFSSLSWRFIIGFIYYVITMLIYYLIVNYQNLQEKILNEASLKNMVKETELNMLKNQINPHFLFNSLNSISSLTLSNPSKAQEMIIKLSEYMRYSLSQRDRVKTSFETELENNMRYLEIEKSRFGKKLQYENTIDDACKQATLPVMLLQPIYENAVKHGVYESIDDVIIKTDARMVDGKLFIRISNTFDPDAAPRKGTGTGLRNIRERLTLLYHANWLVKTDKKENTFVIELIIPQ